jgi:hypothetical protein
MLAAFTAYTRKVQSTVTTLQKQIPRAADTIATPAQQSARILEWSPGRGASLGKLSGRSFAREPSLTGRGLVSSLCSREGPTAGVTNRSHGRPHRRHFLTGFALASVGGRTAAS